MASRFQAWYLERCQIGGVDLRAHLPRLYEVVVEMNAQQVIELGVKDGESTITFLAALERTGGKLWSCDIAWPINMAAEILDDMPDNWTFMLADDREIADLAPVWCDVLFIDTSHTYAHTLEELQLYGPKVRPGGVIILHDTGLPDVWQAIHEYIGCGTGYEFTNVHESYGLGLIYTPGEPSPNPSQGEGDMREDGEP